MEGSQPVKPDQQPVVPITPPLFEHTHLDSRSISGGHFWQSDRIAELQGAYLYGDWMTGKVWALKFKGDQVHWQQELVDTPHRVICFMLDPSGEVLIVCYDGTILRLEPNNVAALQDKFPTKLSETGLFADVASQIPAQGVVEYEISAHHWADGTHSRQWIGIPNAEQLSLFKTSDWKTGQTAGRFVFPVNTVVAKTVSYHADAADPKSERHLETQLLHKLDDEWRAYNYIWNQEQTEAVLQSDQAIDRELIIRDAASPGGKRMQVWRHASRNECLLCHIWSSGTALGFWPNQLNIDWSGSNQLEHLNELGLFKHEIPRPSPLTDPHDESASLESRARSYLAMNCSSCHRRLGGGTATFNFDIINSLADNNYLDAAPAQGTFGIHDARVVAPGDPFRSVLLYRTLKSGRGHMPQFGSNVIDHGGLKLLHDWIASLPSDQHRHRHHQTIQQLKQSQQPSADVTSLLSSVESAMALSLACSDDTLAPELRKLVIALGAHHDDAPIRDLFEHYLPPDQRVKRLGPTIDEQALLAMDGSVQSGERLFQQAKDINCRACHRVGAIGKEIGPNLSGIGTQRTPAELLASLVRPSEKIDAKYRARQILTTDGDVIIGIVTSETDQALTVADAAGKSQTIAVDEIENMRPASKSAMPEQLLSGMTPQHAADLLAYLSAQKQLGPLQHKRTKIKRARSGIVIDGRRDESAWSDAESVGDFVFTWWKEGDPPQQPTDAKLLWDDNYLYVSFVCTDQTS